MNNGSKPGISLPDVNLFRFRFGAGSAVRFVSNNR